MGEGVSRRELLELGVAALVAQAVPVALRASPAAAQTPIDDLVLGAFADTIIPGRPATVTDRGDPIPAGGVAGGDPDPGAVEAGAIQLYHDPRVGFDALAPAFIADLNTRALSHGGPFVSLPLAKRGAG